MIAAVLKKALQSSAFFIALSAAVAAPAETAAVRYVTDGDSLVLSDGRQVRLIGINAPEFGKDGAPHQPLAQPARERLAQLIGKQRITLAPEQERRDHYGRLLARVILPDGSDAGERLLREGLAWVIAIPPNLEKLAVNQAAENEAHAARRGVWNEPAYAPKAAEQLTMQDTGFQLVEGRIRRSGEGRRLVYLDLAPQLSLAIPRADWKMYFKGRPADWVGRRVMARGWVTASKDRLRLRLSHPAMLTWRD